MDGVESSTRNQEVIACNLSRVQRVLCLGAHSDDIEIGCGGTVLRMIEQSKSIEFYWLVLGANPMRAKEAERSANAFLRGARHKTVVVKSFRDGFLPYIGAPVKEAFEEIKTIFVPDVIFTHFRQDLHQDHRMVCELTWNTFRNHFILEYEVPKYDADLRSPNFFVPLSDRQARKQGEQADALLCYAAKQAVVLGGFVLRSNAITQHRSRLTHPTRGGVSLP